MLFISGSEGKVMLFNKNDKKWIYSCNKKSHFNDVNCLILNKNILISGGNDSFLISYNINNFIMNSYAKYYQFNKDKNCSISSEKNLILTKVYKYYYYY